MTLILSACDTGSANAFAPVLSRLHGDYLVFAQTHAARVFDRWTIPYELVGPFGWPDLQVAGDGVLSRIEADAVVTGTSWGPSIDKALTLAARARGIACAALVEHWDLYLERFSVVTDGRIVDRNAFIPDRVWVPDSTARIEASAAGVPAEIIDVVGQPHLEGQLKRLRAHSRSKGPDIVFVSERVSTDFAIGSPLYRGFDEFVVLEHLLEIVDLSASRLVIKLHPQEPIDKFASAVEGRPNVHVVKEADNIELITTAGRFVGMFSMLLLEAALIRADVISFLPGGQPSIFVGNRIGATMPATTRAELESLLRTPVAGPGGGRTSSAFGERFIGSTARLADAMERLAFSHLPQ